MTNRSPENGGASAPLGPPLKYFYTIRESALALGLSKSTIYELMADGRLTRVKFGGRTLVTWESVQAFYDALVARRFVDRGGDVSDRG